MRQRRETQRVVGVVVTVFVLIETGARVERILLQQQHRDIRIGHASAVDRRVAAGQSGQRGNPRDALRTGESARITGHQDGGFDPRVAGRCCVGTDHVGETAGLRERHGFRRNQQDA